MPRNQCMTITTLRGRPMVRDVNSRLLWRQWLRSAVTVAMIKERLADIVSARLMINVNHLITLHWNVSSLLCRWTFEGLTFRSFISLPCFKKSNQFWPLPLPQPSEFAWNWLGLLASATTATTIKFERIAGSGAVQQSPRQSALSARRVMTMMIETPLGLISLPHVSESLPFLLRYLWFWRKQAPHSVEWWSMHGHLKIMNWHSLIRPK
jgi:hypothetical protein